MATEIVRVLTGSIGLVAAIPLTAFFAALLATRGRLRHS
ncbi:MAG: YibE/F family protein [Brockia lithotrophica]|nr:YibE/F family protein [Brockia lithotrophica]